MKKQKRWKITPRIVLKFLRRRKGFVFTVVLIAGIWFWRCLPSPLFDTPYSLVSQDRAGELLGASIADDGQWRFPPILEVPEKYMRAVVLYEDQNFFRHPGVDPAALARALWSNIRSGRIVSGASTLNMQVIRLARNRSSRTLWEKIVEMVLAVRLEISSSKKEILALYASHAPFGGNVVGLEAASWRYFGRSPDRLSWAESAMLAVLPNSPSLIHPGRSRDLLSVKRNSLLDKLRSRGIIDQITCDLGKQEPLPPEPLPLPMLAPHLHDRIKIELMSRNPDNKRGKKPAAQFSRVKTSVDSALQVRVTDIVRRHNRELSGNGIHNAAVLVLDVETKQALAYIGNASSGRDPGHGSYVDVITSPRSTGSILKPLLYASMIDTGELLPHELVADIPTRIGSYVPQNFTRTYEGALPAHMALARSKNIPAVRMLYSFGLDRFYSGLKNFGMTTLHRPASGYGLTLILGGAEGSLWEITGIYAGLARTVNDFFKDRPERRNSFFHPGYLSAASEIRSAPDHETGSTCFSPDSHPLSAAACWLTLEAMVEVTRPDVEGSWRNFSSSRKIAWKTGTSYGLRDGWAVGVTPSYAVGVWVGNADGEGRPGLTGIGSAAPIMFEVFGILDGRGWFDIPEFELPEITICSASGHRAGPFCEHVKVMRVPLAGLRGSGCPYCRAVHCDTSLQWRVNSQCERVTDIRVINRFVLPPALEWFYRKKHSDYLPLPPFRRDCLNASETAAAPSLSLIYPRDSGKIYIPLELDGNRGKAVFEAAHREPRTVIYWHLDKEFIGTTHDIHQMALVPDAGLHTLTLVDENGERLERTFVVLSKESHDD